MIHAQNLEKSENSTTYDNCLKHHDVADQGLGTPDSLSPLSEPPDITNWFSSYKYETLVLETNDNFGFSDHEDSNTGNIVENSSTLIKHNESEEDNKCESQVEKSDYQDLPLLSSEDPIIENENWLFPEVDRLLGHRHKQSMVEKDTEKEEGCNGKLQVKNGENLCLPNDLICNKTLEEETDVSVSDKENVQEVSTDNVNSFEKVGPCDSGFVSIMKNKREIGENSVMMRGNLSLRNEKRCVQRKALGDRTNNQQLHSSYSGEMMITGKWKCPRKSKPEIGPPLKQLRLGQWFHHIM